MSVLFGFFVVVLFQVLLDPFTSLVDVSENVQARVNLPLSRKKWDAGNIDHYRFDIMGYVPLLCMFGGNIEIRNGKVISTSPRSDAEQNLLASLATLSAGSGNKHFLCDYQNYTVPLRFDELERSLSRSISSVTEIYFDPQYGFFPIMDLAIPVDRDCLVHKSVIAAGDSRLRILRS